MTMTDQIVAKLIKMMEPIREAWVKLRDAVNEIAEAVEGVQEREKTRAYEHMITPPHDHTHSHVTHTSSKPPHDTHLYRRRTP